ncbi:hypothetical protein MTO96_038201, partial [Rhipicephalus appendiculatus]
MDAEGTAEETSAKIHGCEQSPPMDASSTAAETPCTQTARVSSRKP